jgi:DNA polymerase-3 subunit alpha
LLDGLSRIHLLVERAKELGMDALGITDHGGMYGAVEFYRACRAAGIKPILGCELYVAHESRLSKTPSEKAPFHLTVLAKNNIGYKNLLKLVTKSHLEGFYYKPRVDRELLEAHREGLIVLAGCPSAEVPRLLIQGRDEEAKEAALWYKETFPDYYLEVQRHSNLPDLELLNPALVKISKEMDIPLVASNDLHYVYQEDSPFQDIYICIQTNTNVKDVKRLKMSDDSYFLRSSAEMSDLFADMPQAVENTQLIAGQCNVDLDFSTLHLPQYPTPEGEPAEGFLEQQCLEGLKKRFGAPSEEARRRLAYELDVIKTMQFSNYFLVVWDIATFVHDQGILFGVRGSAAASLALYCLGVTNVDPLEYRLVFERFLNLERKEMPDIDMDFQDDRRDEVIRYVAQKYGNNHVAQIITFGTLGAKAAIRDVGRALALPYQDVDQIARLIPTRPHITLEEAIAGSPELQEMHRGDAILRELIDSAKKLEGVVRNVSTHAAGVVICEDPLDDYVALQRPIKSDSGIAMTQFSMEPLAQLGLLKMDFLGLTNLSILAHSMETVARNHGVQLSLHSIPLDDRKAFDILGRGETIGVFQLESSGMRRHIKDLKPASLNELAAMIALYRPGPMEHIETFIQAKYGKRQVKYPHPALQDILEETYGVIVYQDQVLLILQAFAGYSLGEADVVRKAMGKKIPELMAQERDKFVKGALTKGYEEQLAKEVFDLIEPFAGYAFNKAHSVSYALIAYWTAYFKANYPADYMTAMLNAHLGDQDKVQPVVDECTNLNIVVMPPDVIRSDVGFTLDKDDEGNDGIRFGLAAVKNVGTQAMERLVQIRQEGRPFTSVEDLCRRADLRALNRRALESLIKAGALDNLGPRGSLFASVDRIIAISQREHQLQQSGQTTMFDLFGDSVPTPLGELDLRYDEATTEQKAIWEKEMLGVSLSHNLFRILRRKISTNDILSREDIDFTRSGQQVETVGVVSRVVRRTTKDGKDFAFVDLQMFKGSIEVVVWSRELERTDKVWKQGMPVRIVGKVRTKGDQVSIVCNDAAIVALDEEELPKDESQGPYMREWTTESDHRDVLIGETAQAEKKPEARTLSGHDGRRRLLINLTETQSPQKDASLLREVMEVVVDYPGTDAIDLLIGSNGRLWRLEMPLFTTGYCEDLHRRLSDLLGRWDAVELEV